MGAGGKNRLFSDQSAARRLAAGRGQAMKEIHSADNKNYKLCVRLKRKKYRDQYGLYLIEGEHLLEEAAKRGARPRAIFVRQGLAFVERPGFPEPFALSGALFKNLTQTEASQGVVAAVEAEAWTEERFFEACAGKNILLLDRIQDPGNLGTMVRTAEAAGYGGVMLLKGTGDVYGAKSARAAAGSVFSMPVLPVSAPEEALRMLRESGRKTVGACFDTERAYDQGDLENGIALMIGNEGAGLCGPLAEGADVKVRIPMENGVNSLNASVAAGILMYESRRKDRV